LLKPICVTVLVLNILWIWNDFLLPALVIMKKELQTIPLSINTLFATYAKQWDLAMAALVMSIIPLIIVFLFLQKHIIRGITEGAVKS
jgi:raffinose/stachyose/melibiose transport system permease protein